jgi:hypothetical protein
VPSHLHEDADRRAARIEMILEELRLNTEDLRELARQAHDRAVASRRAVRPALDHPRRNRRRARKKR